MDGNMCMYHPTCQLWDPTCQAKLVAAGGKTVQKAGGKFNIKIISIVKRTALQKKTRLEIKA